MLGYVLRGHQRPATLTNTGVPNSAPPFPSPDSAWLATIRPPIRALLSDGAYSLFNTLFSPRTRETTDA